MKKTVCLFLICTSSAMAYAFPVNPKKNPIVDNSSIRRSKKEESKQQKEFDSPKYSSLVNSHRAKAMRKQRGKQTGKGKGL